MIRFRPYRSTLSSSYKDEKIFSTLGEMLQYVFDKHVAYLHYVGSKPPALSDLDIVMLSKDHRIIGYRNECKVIFRRDQCVGYCGE